MARLICHVVDYGGPTGGSFIPALESLSRAVVKRGDRFAVCATKIPQATWPAELEQSGAEVHLVSGSAGVIEVLRRLKPAIVHAHFTRYDLDVLRGGHTARIFWHVHSHREVLTLAARAKALLKYRLFGRRVEALVAVSRTLASECVAFGAPPAQVRVVLNGIDTQRFRPPAVEERSVARASFGFSDDDRVVLFFERVPYKGGATVCEALANAAGLRLLVVGGTQLDRDRFAGLPGLVSIARVADTRQLYWAADVLAFASDNEAFGFVLAEALSSGLPVAATDIPIVHEICGSIDGIGLFPVNDAPALCAALEQLPGHGTAAGRARMIARFDVERWTSDMLALYG
jgi:glycosyltransferase involved in cell wall biosynthesis